MNWREEREERKVIGEKSWISSIIDVIHVNEVRWMLQIEDSFIFYFFYFYFYELERREKSNWREKLDIKYH
jgi:hypothetical protein